MLPLGQNGYLRVTTPQTSDGTTLLYTDDQRLLTKETHLPLTAKKFLEAENETLPQHLRHKIEVVSDDSPSKAREARPVNDAKAKETTPFDSKADRAKAERAKPGPKPKGKEVAQQQPTETEPDDAQN